MNAPRPPSLSRVIDLSVEVPGTPAEVWESIASGPGITSWFVPARVDGRPGGKINLNFGPGMDEQAEITVWEPPHQFTYQESAGRNLAYAFTVAAQDGGTCIVRLVNSGFGEGAEWDNEIESMTGGWKLFLHMLALSRKHFPGQECSSAIVNVVSPAAPDAVWDILVESLGLAAQEVDSIGAEVTARNPELPALSGSVVRRTPGMATILLDQPTTGVAFLLAEPWQNQTVAGIYLYLFGDTAAETLSQDESAWRDWLARTVPTSPAADPPTA
ncbi:MAG: SRPBCC domain-containing protein [Chloroflexota bacterium]